MYILRDYQQECVDFIDQMETGSGLVALATGAGGIIMTSQAKTA